MEETSSSLKSDDGKFIQYVSDTTNTERRKNFIFPVTYTVVPVLLFCFGFRTTRNRIGLRGCHGGLKDAGEPVVATVHIWWPYVHPVRVAWHLVGSTVVLLWLFSSRIPDSRRVCPCQ
jgi:hypothetical protein